MSELIAILFCLPLVAIIKMHGTKKQDCTDWEYGRAIV